MALGFACVILNGLAGWSAFRGPNWLTNGITVFIGVMVLGLLLNLSLHKGDWRFRAPAFAVVGAYLTLMAFEIWQYYTHAD